MASTINPMLENQVLQDYGQYLYKYKAFDLATPLAQTTGGTIGYFSPNQVESALRPARRNIRGRMTTASTPDFRKLNDEELQAYNAELQNLRATLPKGTYIKDNKLYIDPNSQYYTAKDPLAQIRNDIANQRLEQIKVDSYNEWAQSNNRSPVTSSNQIPGDVQFTGADFDPITYGATGGGHFNIKSSGTSVGPYTVLRPTTAKKTSTGAQASYTGPLALLGQGGYGGVDITTDTAAPSYVNPEQEGVKTVGIFGNPFGMGVYAKGGAVKGYAEGDLVEADTDPYRPIPVPAGMALMEPTAPDYRFVGTQQAEPTGGGYVPGQEAELVQARPNQLANINPELYALMQQYTTGPDYTEELKRVGQERRTAEAGFNKALESAMAGADQGPSKAELYFRLAAAFGTPSKTGAFAEGLGQAAGAAAEYKKEERTAATAKRKLATDILLKKQELALEGVKDREKTLLALQSDNAKDRREAIKGIINEYIQSGKPQSEAGKIAKDKGFKVGTPEYQTEVDKQAKILLENKLAQITATLGGLQIQAGNLALATKKEERAASELDAGELKILTENKQAIKSTQSAMDLMDEAQGLVDKAFTKSTADQAEYQRLKKTDPKNERVVATEQLEQILTTSALQGLRAAFGGSPTEGERNVQLLTQGLSASSSASRRQIINRIKNGLIKNKTFYEEANEDLLSGSYKKRPKAKE